MQGEQASKWQEGPGVGNATCQEPRSKRTQWGLSLKVTADTAFTRWELAGRTEHSSSEVCTQPDRSFRTQQAECFSRSRAALMKLCTCGSWRMQGENLAPRWIRASYGKGDVQLQPQTPTHLRNSRLHPQPRPHRAGTNPEVFLLHILDVFIDTTVPQHLESQGVGLDQAHGALPREERRGSWESARGSPSPLSHAARSPRARCHRYTLLEW